MQRQKERQERKREAQLLWSIAQVLLWQLEPARQPAMLRHLIFCLPSFLLSQCVDPSASLLSLSLSSFVSLSPFVRQPFSPAFFLHALHSPVSSHLPALSCHFFFFFFSSFPWARSLHSSLKVCANPLLFVWTVYVCVGGRGSSSLHPSGSAPDPAALQAGGESHQERFPVPQEALP